MNNYLLTAAAFAAAAVVYTAVGFASSKKLCLRRAKVYSGKIKNTGVRILHISDLHNCRFGENQSELASLANVSGTSGRSTDCRNCEKPVPSLLPSFGASSV